MPFQPDVEIEFTIEVDYDPLTSVAPQPEIDIDTWADVEYTPPPSLGGQPSVITMFLIDTSYEPEPVTTDLAGEAEIVFQTKGSMDVTTQPVPVPVLVDLEDVKIVSLTMPVPQDFDRYGRPTA